MSSYMRDSRIRFSKLKELRNLGKSLLEIDIDSLKKGCRWLSITYILHSNIFVIDIFYTKMNTINTIYHLSK